MKWWAAAGLAALLAGCGGAAGAAGAAAHSTTPAAAAAPAWPWMQNRSDPVAARMREVQRGMSAAGLHVGPIGGSGFLALRGGDTFPVDVPAGTCMTITALASSGVHDLDTTLYLPTGDVLAEDVEPDAHPTVQVCATHAARHLYYHLQAYDGAGAYLYASFVGPRSAFPAAARVVGGRPGVAANPGTATAQQGRVHELTEGAARRGFEPIHTPASVQLAAGQRVRIPLTVKAAHCYTVAAFGGAGLTALTIRVLDEEAHEVTRDVAGTASPGAQFCAHADGDYAVELHAVGGRGAARIAFFQGPAAAVGGTGGLWLGQRHETLASNETLDQALARDLAAARRAGWSGAARRAGASLAPAQAVDDVVELDPGHCTLVLATGGRGIGELALRLLDDRGQVLAARPPSGPTASARLCVDQHIRAHAEIVARRGSGAFALETLTKTLPAGLPADAGEWDRGRLLDALDAEKALGRGLEGAITKVVLPAGHAASVPAPVPPHGCEHVYVIATGRDGSVGAELRRGSRVAARQGGRSLSFEVCAGSDPGHAVLSLTRQGHTDAAFVLRFPPPQPSAAAPAGATPARH